MENVHLPHELKAAIIAHLDKPDLKTVRLVSREWSALATSPLFDKVYVSCRAPDLEVFRNITRHPVISAGVKELVYDDSFFIRDVTFSEYFYKVSEGVRCVAQFWQSDIQLDNADVRINDFCRDCLKTDVDFSELYESHRKDSFLVKGYHIYRHYSAFEWQVAECGCFFEELSTGLDSLKGLRSVVLDHRFWNSSEGCNKFFNMPKARKSYRTAFPGSPLSRIWDPFHLGPLGWQMLEDLDIGRSRITAQIHMLTRAIRATKKEITSLQTVTHDGHVLYDGCVPHQALTVCTLTKGDLLENFMTAYSGLRCLDLRIATDSNDHQDALIVLPDLLRQMNGLERLSLQFSRDDFHHSSRDEYRYDEVFPALGSWPNLKDLSLVRFAIGGWDLLVLVFGRARLRRLELANIDLLDGTWEGVVEGLRRRSAVTELDLHNTFTHRGGAVFKPGPSPLLKNMTCGGFLDRVMSYVERGGRHPCLTPDSHPDTALWWFQDLIPTTQREKMKLFAREQGLDGEGLVCK